jgi:hypothetical protein
MINLIVVGMIVLCIVVAWTTSHWLGNTVRFRRVARERGVTLAEIEPSGTLILDYVYGASIGIGSPILWYNPPADSRHGSADMISDRTRIVLISAESRNLQTLKTQFPGVRIIESTTL